MICAIMQPTYIPWIGYFDMIDKVDTFVFYDDVQLAKRSWQVRNRIKGSNNEVWLTLPIIKNSDRDNTLINSAILSYSENWLDKHIKTIENCYKKSLYYSEIMEFIMPFYVEKSKLVSFNIDLILGISKEIGINTKIIKSSELLNIGGKKDQRLVQICKEIRANEYLSPQGSSDYINSINLGGEFPNNNIELYYHDYIHPTYPQLYNEFVPYMGIYDLLFNVGFKNALEIIRTGRKDNIFYKNL